MMITEKYVYVLPIVGLKPPKEIPWKLVRIPMLLWNLSRPTKSMQMGANIETKGPLKNPNKTLKIIKCQKDSKSGIESSMTAVPKRENCTIRNLSIKFKSATNPKIIRNTNSDPPTNATVIAISLYM